MWVLYIISPSQFCMGITTYSCIKLNKEPSKMTEYYCGHGIHQIRDRVTVNTKKKRWLRCDYVEHCIVFQMNAMWQRRKQNINELCIIEWNMRFRKLVNSTENNRERPISTHLIVRCKFFVFCWNVKWNWRRGFCLLFIFRLI